MDITVLEGISYSNTKKLKYIYDSVNKFSIDIPYSKITVSRTKTIKQFDTRTEQSEFYAENQSLNINISGFILENNIFCKSIKEDLYNTTGLNKTYEFELDGYRLPKLISNNIGIDYQPGNIVSYSVEFSVQREV